MLGVNISGGEYKESGLAYGRDYIFPSNAEIDYYAGKGMDVIRVPFQWERMQKVENGALNGEEVARLKAVVAYANTKGLTVILDAHDYGTRTIAGTSYKLGVDEKAPASLLADFWGRMATEFKGSDVFYGIMNEPHYQSAAQWAPVANAAIQAIREAGASEKILVPGTNWTGAHNWVSGQNDTEIGAKVVDPVHNFAFEVHQYLDSDSSGTHASVVSETIGVAASHRDHRVGQGHGQPAVPGRVRGGLGCHVPQGDGQHAPVHGRACRHLAGGHLLGRGCVVGQLHVLDRAHRSEDQGRQRHRQGADGHPREVRHRPQHHADPHPSQPRHRDADSDA